MDITRLADTIDDILGAGSVPEIGGIVQAGGHNMVTRIGFALDWDPDVARRAIHDELDAIWLHRISRRDPPVFPPGLAVLCHHAAFDTRYGFAGNLDLQAELSTLEIVTLSERPALAIARLKTATDQDRLAAFLRQRFGGIERNYGKATEVSWIALADAMRPELIAAAVSAGAQLYLTGQWRPSAEEAAADSGLSVIAVGHALIEHRGLADLRAEVTRRCPNLTVIGV